MNNALKELLLNYPELKQLYEDLLRNGIEIVFNINSLMQDPALFNATLNSISFQSLNTILGSNLMEELIHAAQCNLYYAGVWDVYHNNIEYEAKIFQDIITRLDLTGSGWRLEIFLTDNNLKNQYYDFIWRYVNTGNYNELMNNYYNFFDDFHYPEVGKEVKGVKGKEPDFLNKYLGN